MFQVRAYKHADFETICSWWSNHLEVAPIQGMMIENGTFVVDYKGEPVMSLTVFLTQSKEMSYFEGFIAKPDLDKAISNQASELLFECCFKFVKDAGYRNVFAYSKTENVTKRVQKLGLKHRAFENMTLIFNSVEGL